MMPRFFKDMPKNLNEVGKWEIKTYALLLTRDKVVYKDVYEGKKWIAYLKIRARTLVEDWKTLGSHSGIAWSMQEQGETNKEVYGYKG